MKSRKSDGDSYARMFDKEYSNMTKEEKEQTDKAMEELDGIIDFDEDEIEQKGNEKNNKLQQLIEENCGPDPFWLDCLKNFFENVNKTLDEKIEFFSNLVNNKALFNEFTKEIVNPVNADDIFERYTLTGFDNYRFFKQNDTDLTWWIDNHQKKWERLFSFDGKKVYNLFKDYPHNLTKKEKEIFDRENPYWRDYFTKKANNESVKQSKSNLQKLKRTKLVDFINDKFNCKSDDISKFTISVIDEIIKMMENYSYKYDTRFYTYGRREFLEKEIEWYLGNNKILEAYFDFYEFIAYEGLSVFSSDIPNNMNLETLFKENNKYIKDGIICEQEKNIIISILTMFKNRFYNTSISIDEKSLKKYAPILVDEEIDVDIERACDILKESCEICNISEIIQVKRLAKISSNSEGEAIEITDNTGEKYYIGIGGYGFIEIVRKNSIDGKIIFVPIED